MRRVAALVLLGAACVTGRPPPSGTSAGTAAPSPSTPAAKPTPPATGAPKAPSELPPSGSAVPQLPPLPRGGNAADPLDLLWSHRPDFSAGGAPVVTIRLEEGQDELAFRPRARARVSLRGAVSLELPAGETFHVRLRAASAAVLARHTLLAQFDFRDRSALEASRRSWEARGVRVQERTIGAVYGIAGRVIDNRRRLLVADTAAGALPAGGPGGDLATHFAELVARPSGRLDLLDAAGQHLGTADTVLSVEIDGDAGFVLSASAAGRDPGEMRAYRGRLHVTVDAQGKLAAVDAMPLEDLLRGLVPSEMPAGSPLEALKAQAVTARSNVLAQIGTRHLTDPYVLCSEVHCQAYRGEAAEAARADAAVRATAGEALFGRGDRALVDAVYSAMCGGHGEDNDAVWGNVPSSSLRGLPDLSEAEARAWQGGLRDEARLRRFLAAAPDAYCRRAGPRDRYRWERRFGASELSALAASLEVGRVTSVTVTSRGISGRARSLRVDGEHGHATVHGELRIRKLLGNLPSAMFVVERDGKGVVLRGGGWGHGAGMCQWGAVGRAVAGQGYREILRAYFSGAEVAKIY